MRKTFEKCQIGVLSRHTVCSAGVMEDSALATGVKIALLLWVVERG